MFLTLQELEWEHDFDYEDPLLFWRHAAFGLMACAALLVYGLFKETMGDGTLLAGNSKDIHWACRAASVLGRVSFQFSFPCMFSFQLVGGAHGSV